MRIRSLALFTGLVLVTAAGCSKGSSTTAYGGPSTTSAPAAAATTPGSDSGAAGGAVAVALADSSLGKILVDSQGMTVYVFTKDTATTSACSGGCASAWPALLGAKAQPGSGLNDDDFTTITRQDGTTQVVFYGHPLYTYAADSAPGQTTGQGTGGNWFVVGADGNPITTTTP